MTKYSYYGYEYYYNKETQTFYYESKNNGEILNTKNERDIINYIDQERKPNNKKFNVNFYDCGFDIY